jgi:serine/threonine protein kinase
MERKDLTPFLKARIKPKTKQTPEVITEDTKTEALLAEETRIRRLKRDFVTIEEKSLDTLYNFGQKLGQGVYGSVFLCTNRVTNEKVAVKSVNRVDMYLREPEILSFLKGCPGVLPINKVVATQKRLLMEFPLATSLRSWLDKELYTETDFKAYLKGVFNITMDLVEAVACIHAKEIIHRDIKPDNILIYMGRAVLIDFGFSKRTFQRQEKASYELVTPLYRAPEISTTATSNNNQVYTTCIDEWSLGIVLYEILTGSLPFGGGDNMVVIQERIKEWEWCLYHLKKKVPMKEGNILLNYKAILRKKFPMKWEDAEQKMLNVFDNLLSNLLHPSPSERYLCLDVIKHTNRYETLVKLKNDQHEALAATLTLKKDEIDTWNSFLSYHSKTDSKVLLFAGLLWYHVAPLVHSIDETSHSRSMMELFGALKMALEFFVFHAGVMRWAKHLPDYQNDPTAFDRQASLLEHHYLAKSKSKVFYPHPLYKKLKPNVDLVEHIPSLMAIFEQK